MAFAAYAQKYHEHGLSVFPCDGKIAVIKGWQGFCLNQPTDEQIDEWAIKYPNHGIAMALGEKIVALDIDVDDSEFENELFRLIPRSMCLKIGKKGGTSFYRNGGIQDNKHLKFKKFTIIDILKKAYTVLPPSLHPDTGKEYFWKGMDILSCDLDSLPFLTEDNCLKIQALIDRHFNKFAETGYQIHGRNNFLFSEGCRRIKRGERDITTLANQLHAIDQVENESNPYFYDQKENFKTKKTGIDRAIEFSERLMATYAKKDDEKKQETSENGFYFRVQKEDGRIVMQPDYYGLADHMVNEIGFKSKDNYSWIYKENHYQPIGTQSIHNLILSLTQSQAKPNHINGFCMILLAKSQMSKDEISLRYLNFKNGMYDLEKRILIPHDKKIFSVYALPFEYDEKAKCPKFNSFLENTFKDPDIVSLVEEVFGACLDGSHNKWQKAFCFTGAEQSSKSTVMKILSKLLGKKNCTSVNLDNLDNQYALQTLDGKLANILEEIPDKPIDAQLFKALTSEGEVLVSAKFKDPYQLKVTAKFVFAANGLPRFSSGNYSGALARRIIAIPCNNQIKDSERIAGFENTFEDEMPGIFNLALNGLVRLEKRGSFPIVAAIEAKKEEFKQEIDSVYDWLGEHLEIDHSEIRQHQLRQVFLSYAADVRQDGGYPVKKSEFFKRFRSFLATKVGSGLVSEYIYKPHNVESIRRVKLINISDQRVF